MHLIQIFIIIKMYWIDPLRIFHFFIRQDNRNNYRCYINLIKRNNLEKKKGAWRRPTLALKLSLAQDVFTTEFGMESGGTRPLLSPGKPVYNKMVNKGKYIVAIVSFDQTPWGYRVKLHGQLVWVSSTPLSAYTSHLSTSSSPTDL